MKILGNFPRYYAASLVALVLIAISFGFSLYPKLTPSQSEELAASFAFAKVPLPEVADRPPYKKVRKVHPSLDRIASWISSLGAAVTLADLDGDGLPNDVVWVDPRTDLVTVAPVPETGERYEPFALKVQPLPYDSESTAPMGTVAGDFNEDGRMDVMVYFWGRTPVLFLRQGKLEGMVARSFLPTELIGSGERWYSNGATQADLDGDGHVDLVIGNYFQDNARILDANATGREVMHAGKSKAYNGGRNRLFLWQGTGDTSGVRFKEVTGVLTEEMDRAWTLAVGAADLDGDLLPEIYFANDFGPDRLLHNRSRPGQLDFVLVEGRRHLNDPKSCVLGFDSFKGMGVDFGDVNGDGMLDIYVSNIATKFGLCESHFLWVSSGSPDLMQEGVAPYEHGAERYGVSRSGWGWETRFGDFNNDGVLEMVQAVGFLKGEVNRWPELQALGTSNDQIIHNPKFWPTFKPGADLSGHDTNPFFVRAKDGRYYDVAPELGLAKPMVSKGIATADVDGDGRLDMAVANQWETSYFFYNRAPDPGAYLGLHLLLPLEPSAATGETIAVPGHPTGRRGRPAIGAEARVQRPDGRVLVGQVDGGSGHSGRRSPDVHFGLGDHGADVPVMVTLSWRDPAGNPHRKTLELTPGWHTVWLGWSRSPQVALDTTPAL